MKKINQNEINNEKLSLKPEELTFANVIENNYNFSDINESIGNNTKFLPLDNNLGDDSLNNLYNTLNTLDTNFDNSLNHLDTTLNSINNNNTNNTNNTNSETLDSLLF